jgi:hypothetical protein
MKPDEKELGATKPLAVYRQTIPGVRCLFKLFDEKLSVTGTIYPDTEFSATIPLETVSPDYHTLRTHSGYFMLAICAFIVSLVSTLVVYYFAVESRGSGDALAWAAGLGAATIASLVWAFWTSPKLKFFHFINADSGTLLFHVAYARARDRERCERFIDDLVEVIAALRAAKSKGAQGPQPAPT